MKNTRTQAGKGLSGFMIGLLLATAVIAGVLFFLNKNKTPFKQPEIQTQTPPPEILTPGGQSASTPPTAPASDVLGSFIASQVAASSETASTQVNFDIIFFSHFQFVQRLFNYRLQNS